MTDEERAREFVRWLESLLKGCEAANSQGLSRMLLIKTWRRAPKNFERAMILPGLYGRVIGSKERHKYLVDVLVADVVRALEKVVRVTP